MLCTSPYCNQETVAILELMITCHHATFIKLYPKSPIIPKMHYMLHLPRQMSLYGPLRSSWCMRFEAKHSCFKGKKWKNFRNLPLSVCLFHEKLMCSRRTTGFGQPNKNFLYACDDVKIKIRGLLSQTYPTLRDTFMRLLGNEHGLEPLVYFAKVVNIHGHKYQPGCVLVTGYDDDDMPQMAKVIDIFVHDDIKYFIMEILGVVNYDDHFMSFAIQSCHETRLMRHSDLFSIWPQSLYRTADQIYFVNRYSHTCEFPWKK